MIATVVEAILKAGLPIGIAAFMMLSIAYKRGHLRSLSSTSELRKEIRKISKNKKTKEHGKTGSRLIDRWFNFGGGFYGFVSMYTFFFYELKDVLEFLPSLPEYLSNLTLQKLFMSVISTFGDSISYFFRAAFWPFHWKDELSDPLIWLVVVFFSWEIALMLVQNSQRRKPISIGSETSSSTSDSNLDPTNKSTNDPAKNSTMEDSE